VEAKGSAARGKCVTTMLKRSAKQGTGRSMSRVARLIILAITDWRLSTRMGEDGACHDQAAPQTRHRRTGSYVYPLTGRRRRSVTEKEIRGKERD